MHSKFKHGVGFAGSHRTGKTTLAKLVAEQVGVPFIQTSVSKVFSDLGYDPAKDYDLATRLMLQRAVLYDSIKKWESHDGSCFITDRTPVDFIGYTLASAHQEEITLELDDEIQDYMTDCVAAANDYFGIIFEVHPGIPVIHEAGKASTMKSHIDHVALIMSGVINTIDFDPHILFPDVPKYMIALDERIEYCSSFFDIEEKNQ